MADQVLNSSQREALAQFQVLTNSDADSAISILDSSGWDVQRAADLVFGSNPPPPSRPPVMQSLEIDDVGPRLPNRPGLFLTIARPVVAVFAYPFHVVTSILRLVFAIFRIPLPQLNFSALSFYSPLPRSRVRIVRRTPDSWLRELEEETGAVPLASSVSATSNSTVNPGPSFLRARPTALEDGVKVLPDFTLIPYDEMLRRCQKEARIGCVVLVSQDHDDVAEFKRTTLTDPSFVTLLHVNDVLVWGGDVSDRDAWSASEKLQATTYPFVAFVALQPRRNPASSSAQGPPNANPTLTVLSRHQGPSTGSGATSARALCDHLTDQLLPRVKPFLERIQNTRRERESDRRLREEQDRAFESAARRDRERIQNKMKQERLEEERRRTEEKEREQRRLKGERRMEWRRWLRSVQKGNDRNNGLRVAVRLPSGGRAVRTFGEKDTLTSLYGFADGNLLGSNEDGRGKMPKESDSNQIEESVEAEIARERDGADWWGFRLALAYPRKEIAWEIGRKLSEVEILRGGGQVVVEMTNNFCTEDGYETEDSV